MKLIIRNSAVQLRRQVLRLMMLVPPKVRQELRNSSILTRIFEYFDRAKYEPIIDAETWQRQKERGGVVPGSIPLGDYEYIEPARPADLEDAGPGNGEQLFSIILPVYNTPVRWLTAAIESVRGQWYGNWEICIVDDCSDRRETLDYLASLEDSRIRVRHLEENHNIAAASNVALGMARGEFIVLMDHDDELTPDALHEVCKAIEAHGADFVYSDEDKLDESGRFCDPHFKPDFAPDQLLSQNYISHLGVIRKSLVDAVGGFSPATDGAQDYDLYLKVLEQTDRVVHVPRVLYHWRKVAGSTAARFSDKSYAQSAGKAALCAAVARRGLDAEVTDGRYPGAYRVRYEVQGEPLVSIIIPFRDKPELLDMCLESILEKSSWRNFEVVGVSNNSENPATFAAMSRWRDRDSRVRFVEHNIPFNFSEVNNFAVREHARGEHVILLNNDIEIISTGWIESLLEFSQRKDVGAVGGRLLYPDGRLQHAGIILGIGGVAGHSHKYFDGNDHGYFSRPHIIQNVSAVTAACLMVRRSLYLELDGLDEENLQVAFNDVDFCLRLREKGLLNVYTPYCEAVHHESISRGLEDTRDKRERFRQEVLFMMNRHAGALGRGDPYYNPNLTLVDENFCLSGKVFAG